MEPAGPRPAICPQRVRRHRRNGRSEAGGHGAVRERAAASSSPPVAVCLARAGPVLGPARGARVRRAVRLAAGGDMMRIPFSRPAIGEEEIAEVLATLRSGWLTTGPRTQRFEEEFARLVGVPHALATSSCTAALHLGLLG